MQHQPNFFPGRWATRAVVSTVWEQVLCWPLTRSTVNLSRVQVSGRSSARRAMWTKAYMPIISSITKKKRKKAATMQTRSAHSHFFTDCFNACTESSESFVSSFVAAPPTLAASRRSFNASIFSCTAQKFVQYARSHAYISQEGTWAAFWNVSYNQRMKKIVEIQALTNNHVFQLKAETVAHSFAG